MTKATNVWLMVKGGGLVSRPKEAKVRWRRKFVSLDNKTPMQRLLGDALPDGKVCIDYHQQWPTFFKAERLGYIDDRGYLTDKGKVFLGG